MCQNESTQNIDLITAFSAQKPHHCLQHKVQPDRQPGVSHTPLQSGSWLRNHLPPQRTPAAPIGLLWLYCTILLGMWEVLTPREGEAGKEEGWSYWQHPLHKSFSGGSSPSSSTQLRTAPPLRSTSLTDIQAKTWVWRFPNSYKPHELTSHHILPYLPSILSPHFWGCVCRGGRTFKSNCRHCTNLCTNTSACIPPQRSFLYIANKAMITPNKTDHNSF